MPTESFGLASDRCPFDVEKIERLEAELNEARSRLKASNSKLVLGEAEEFLVSLIEKFDKMFVDLESKPEKDNSHSIKSDFISNILKSFLADVREMKKTKKD